MPLDKERPSDSQARRDSYADCVLCRRIFKNLDRKIFEKCHDIKVDLNFQGGLLYTAAYVRWDFFYRNNIFALCWGSFEDRRQHRGKKAFYSIVSSNIPFSFTAISWGLVFILHTTPTFMLLPTHFLEKGKYYILNAVLWNQSNIGFSTSSPFGFQSHDCKIICLDVSQGTLHSTLLFFFESSVWGENK